MICRYTKVGNDWCVRAAYTLTPGDTVTVEKSNGGCNREIVGEFVERNRYGDYCYRIVKAPEIRKLEDEIKVQQAKIQENAAKIKQLDQLRAEVKALHERLKVLTEQLPPESEVSGLLRQIQGLVNKAGLSLKLWRPDRRRSHSSGMYEEIPIVLKLTGGYHNVALFFDSVSKLTRIVNMLNVKMDQPKLAKNGMMEINIDCTAMTFAAVEKKVETPTKPTSAKQVK